MKNKILLESIDNLEEFTINEKGNHTILNSLPEVFSESKLKVESIMLAINDARLICIPETEIIYFDVSYDKESEKFDEYFGHLIIKTNQINNTAMNQNVTSIIVNFTNKLNETYGISLSEIRIIDIDTYRVNFISDLHLLGLEDIRSANRLKNKQFFREQR